MNELSLIVSDTETPGIRLDRYCAVQNGDTIPTEKRSNGHICKR